MSQREELAKKYGELDQFEMFFKDIICPHCKSPMAPRSDTGAPICLNGCDMPHWQWREMTDGLMRIKREMEQEEKST